MTRDFLRFPMSSSLALLWLLFHCITALAVATSPTSSPHGGTDGDGSGSGIDVAGVHSAMAAHARLRFSVVISRHGDRSPAHQSITLVPALVDDVAWRVCPPRASAVLLHGGRAYGKVYDGTSFGGREEPSLQRYDDEESLSTCALGQLTMKGRGQLHGMGQRLRERYVMQHGLLDAEFNALQVRAESTDYPRTMDSIHSQLSGLYPPDTHDALLSSVLNHARRIDIHTTERDLSDLFPNNLRCPRLSILMERIRSSETWRAYHETLKDLKSHLMQALAISDEKLLPSWTALYDVFHSRMQHGYPLISGITQDIVDKLVEVAEFQWSQYLFTLDREYPRLGMQPLMNRIKNMFRAKMMQGETSLRDVKLVTMLGHDTTIGPLVSFLGLQDAHTFQWPKYASQIFLELFELEFPENNCSTHGLDGCSGSTTSTSSVTASSASRFVVHVMHDGTSKIIPGCDSVMCPWPVFDRVTQFYSEDLERVCENDDTTR